MIDFQNADLTADHTADNRYLVNNPNCVHKSCSLEEKYLVRTDFTGSTDSTDPGLANVKNRRRRSLKFPLRSKRAIDDPHHSYLSRTTTQAPRYDSDYDSDYYYPSADSRSMQKRDRKPWFMGPEDYEIEKKQHEKPDVILKPNNLRNVAAIRNRGLNAASNPYAYPYGNRFGYGETNQNNEYNA